MTALDAVVRLADQNAYGAFASRFREHSQRRAIESFDGRTFSYADVERLTARMARFLAQRGVRKGDRVAGLLEKSPEGLMLYLAVARAGGVYVPLSTGLRAAEIDYLLRDAAPRVAIVAPEHEAVVRELAGAVDAAQTFTLDATGGGSFAAAFRACDPDFEPVACTGDDANAIVYTSGTTGHRRARSLATVSPCGMRLCSASGGNSIPTTFFCTRIRQRSASSARRRPCSLAAPR